jgi:signal transduction histidine kinase
MAQPSTGSERRPRLSLFLRTQAPAAASVIVVAAVVLAFGVPVERPGLLTAGLVIVALATVAALVQPWERWPQPAQAAPAFVDLVGVTFIGVALYEQIPTVTALVAFPVIWVGIAAGRWGVLVGVIGGYAASLLPFLVTPGTRSPVEWAEALVVPVVISVITVVGGILTARYDRAADGLVAASRQRNEAAGEAERIGRIMRSFAEEVDVGLLFLDPDGVPFIVNEAMFGFGRLARYDHDARVSTHMYASDQVTPLRPEEQPLSRVRRGEVVHGLLHWVGPRGAQRALVANGRQVHDDHGTFVGSMIVVQDITDIVRAGRAREDALATLAHELRTPLTSIVGYTDLLLLDELPPAASSRVEVILRNAEQLLTLTAVFLDGLHSDAEVNRERIALRDLVEMTTDTMLMTPGFADREVVVDINPELHVVADSDGMMVVLTNLLGNAVKFSRTCDRVTISASADDRSVSLVVHNTGSGIDPEDLERIFDRFYRGGNAQRAAVGGTGIGLSTSREIVSAHGGTLTADAGDDGASFTIWLPRD